MILNLFASASALPPAPDPVNWWFGGAVMWAAIGGLFVWLPIYWAVTQDASKRAAVVLPAVSVAMGIFVTDLIVEDYRGELRDYEALPQLHAARTESTPVETLSWLSVSDREDIRVAVAANEATPPGTLDALSSSPNKHVRAAVAFNLSTPPDTLAALAQDPAPLVRSCVGQNPKTPQDVLVMLARDSDPQVRLAAVRNPSAGPDVLATVEASPANTDLPPPAATRGGEN